MIEHITFKQYTDINLYKKELMSDSLLDIERSNIPTEAIGDNTLNKLLEFRKNNPLTPPAANGAPPLSSHAPVQAEIPLPVKSVAEVVNNSQSTPPAQPQQPEIPLEETAPIVDLSTIETRVEVPIVPDEDEAYIRSLIDPPKVIPSTPDVPAKDNSIQGVHEPIENSEYVRKSVAYDQLVTNPLYQVVNEMLESGETDLGAFLKKSGYQDLTNLSIAELYERKARTEGLFNDDQELAAAIKEQTDLFDTQMTAYERAQERQRLLKGLAPNQNTAIDKILAERNAERTRLQQIEAQSRTILNQKVNALVGTKWRGFQIDKDMATGLLPYVEMYSRVIYDDQGKVKGHDVDHGIAMAMWYKYGDSIIKSIAATTRAVTTKEFLSKRHRPSAESTTTISTPISSRADQVAQARKDMAKDIRSTSGFSLVEAGK